IQTISSANTSTKERLMYALIRLLPVRELALNQASTLGASFIVPASFYEFHSSVLECGAFLLGTWFALDLAVHVLTRLRKSSCSERLSIGARALSVLSLISSEPMVKVGQGRPKEGRSMLRHCYVGSSRFRVWSRFLMKHNSSGGSLETRNAKSQFYGSTAFTLIELLVVGAIIAFLAGLLLPVVARAKARAKELSCLSNARQLSLSVMMYTHDYQEKFPASADYTTPTEIPERIWTMKIMPYAKSTLVYICPSSLLRQFPSNWTERGLGSIGYTTATAFDPESVEGFPSFTTTGMMESPTLSPMFGDTPAGPTSSKYRGFTF